MTASALTHLREIHLPALDAARFCLAARLMVDGLRDELSPPHSDALQAVLFHACDRLEQIDRQIEHWCASLAEAGSAAN
ncbi:hypothetical protein [Ancylobacter sp. IITR112]|uniref:hypothetical protein n=1 Tax=Ancylobacter sp. IITR112 TaxID=3138073 RepID=UPI00352BC7D1